ncbi:PQQ-binding-like beta-propeller repeat protein [Streptomyces sp. NPDC052225]|uniref:outer membrane protein assembly factor BamB family protein n=1 Tax=Streptomyces sp. NPDC052225 TaxID=3154949 RepID=UPI0034302A2E
MAFGPPPSPFTQSQQAAAEQRRRRSRTLAGLVLAVVVALGAGAWLVWPGSGKDAGPDITEQKAVAQAPDDIRESVEDLPKSTPRAGHLVADVQTNTLGQGQEEETPGLWVTKKALVKVKGTTLYGLKGYEPSGKGTVVWSLKLPGAVCGYTPAITVDERTALLLRDPKHGNTCDQLAVIKLSSGKKLWQTAIPRKENFFTKGTTMVMTKGVIATDWQVGAAGYDMRTGKKLWQLNRTKKCTIGGFAGGKALMVRYDCYPSEKDAEILYRVKELEPSTARTKWTYRVADGVGLVSVVSSKPAVLAVGAGDMAATDLISLDSRGKYRATIRLEGGHYEVACSGDGVDDCTQAVVSDDQVFITSGEKLESLDDQTNWVVAFDLATGKSGVKFEAGHDQKMYPLRMSGDRVLALKQGTDEVAPVSLVSLDPKTGKQATYFYFGIPPGAEGFFSRIDPRGVQVEHGRVYFGVPSVTGEEKNGMPTLIRMAFGVGPVG